MKHFALGTILLFASSIFADGIVYPTETEISYSGYFYEEGTIEKTSFSLSIVISPEKVNNLTDIDLVINNKSFDIPTNEYAQLISAQASSVSVAYIKSWVRPSRVELKIPFGSYHFCEGAEGEYLSYPTKTLVFDLSGNVLNAVEKSACST